MNNRTSFLVIAAAVFCLVIFKVPAFADGIKEINVDGLRVIIKQSPKDVISARLFVIGGTANYPLDKQGIESMALNVALNAGTITKTKMCLKQKLKNWNQLRLLCFAGLQPDEHDLY